ncbi:MAG: methyltransferase family protein [Chitinophagales bacterium]
MLIKNELDKHGSWLFKRRGQLPILLLLLGIAALAENKQQLFSGQKEFWQAICFFVSFIGLIIRAYTVGYTPEKTSGRNTTQQIAEILNTKGIYSIVRHPLYVGNFISWLGIALYINSWWLVLIFILIFWIYYERIMYAEEAFLLQKFGEDYFKWAAQTPTFIPRFRAWKSNVLPFSFKKVLRQEYSGLIALVASFAILDCLDIFFQTGNWALNSFWVSAFVATLLLVVTLRSLKKMDKLQSFVW